MNTSKENKQDKENIQSKRHKSVITPTMNDIQKINHQRK